MAEQSLREMRQVGELGKGAFGRVLLVVVDGTYKACKVQSKQRVFTDNQVQHLKAERLFLHTVDSKFVVGMFDSFQDAHNVFFVMDLMVGGALYGTLVWWWWWWA
jgi:serine/threonine protein kinase